MIPHRLAIALAAFTTLSLSACTHTGVAPLPAQPRAKNVILFIGDGMGISTITAARIYAGQKQGQTGEEFVLPFERFGNVALVKTYNTNAQVPDSAGTATAIHSGSKTSMGVLGIGPAAGRGNCAAALAHPLPQMGEQAKQHGLALGIVTTTRITHATPASVYAHSADRDWESDADIPSEQRGSGCADIAAQLVAADFDVALGGGREEFFGAQSGGKRLDAAADLPAQWRARTGGTYAENTGQMAAAPVGRPLLGIFAPSHMTYMVERAADNPEPTLTDMTAAAIARLAAGGKGYYLMVEGGRIDHGHHAGRAGYALEEAVELARAVQYAVDHTDPADTLIMVTADHSHVFTIAGYPRRGNPILGLVQTVEGAGDGEHGLAVDDNGVPFTTLSYANGPGAVEGARTAPEPGVAARQQSLVPLHSETHAGEDVALFAQGPGAQQVRGVIEQNVIYSIIRKAFGWDD